MTACLAFIDTPPKVTLRGDLIEVELASGGGLISFVMTRRVAGPFGRQVLTRLNEALIEQCQVLPLTNKRRKAKKVSA